jgi:hypothetical protein
MGLDSNMAKKPEKPRYAEDEIEEILGIRASEAKLALEELRELVVSSPLLVTGLAFAFGLLIGVGFGQGRRRGS